MADKTMHHVVIGSDTYEIVDSVARVGAEAAFATDSASGAVATFPDGADGVPVKSLSVAVEAVQSGSGDPSPTNIRPISGWDSVKVARCGKNLIALEALSLPTSGHEIKDNNGKITSSSSSTYTHGYIGVKPGTKYIIVGKFTTTSSSAFLYAYDADRNWIQRSTMGALPSDTSSITFTTGSNTYYLQIQYTNTSIGADPTTWGLYEGETVADDTEQGQTYTIDLPQTVYGGTLDVSTGVLTVDHVMVDLGTLNWRKSTSSTQYRTFSANVDNLDYSTNVPTVIADCYMSAAITSGVTADGDNYIYVRSASTTQRGIAVKDTSKASMTAAEYTTAISGHYAVYKMSTPTTLTLTPTEVATLLGQNNIYADSGEVAVTYRADTGLYIDKRLNA